MAKLEHRWRNTRASSVHSDAIAEHLQNRSQLKHRSLGVHAAVCTLRLISSQLRAHVLQILAHSVISPIFSQLSAHARQISAHALQTNTCCGTPISITAAADLQISAQAIIKRKCFGSKCSPPASRQWFIASLKHVVEQAVQRSAQACMSSVNLMASSGNISGQRRQIPLVPPEVARAALNRCKRSNVLRPSEINRA